MSVNEEEIGFEPWLDTVYKRIHRLVFYVALFSSFFCIYLGVSKEEIHFWNLESYLIPFVCSLLTLSLFLICCHSMQRKCSVGQRTCVDIFVLLVVLLLIFAPLFLLAAREGLMYSVKANPFFEELNLRSAFIYAGVCQLIGAIFIVLPENEIIFPLKNWVVKGVIRFTNLDFIPIKEGYIDSYLKSLHAPKKKYTDSTVYTDSDLFKTFQETVSTMYVEPRHIFSNESESINLFVKRFVNRGNTELKILDIGGGDGVATIRFLKEMLILLEDNSNYELNVPITLNIHAYEDTDIHKTYDTALKAKFSGQIEIENKGLFKHNAEIEGDFDIVLAFHSLYGVVSQNDGVNVKTRIINLLSDDGLFVMSLASMYGYSARLKSECMSLLNRNGAVDKFAEYFKFEGDVNFEYFPVYTAFVFNDQNSNKESWLKYFSRCNNGNKLRQLGLLNSLEKTLVKYNDLPEEIKSNVKYFIKESPNQINREEGDNRDYLPHKTEIILVTKNGQN